MRINTKYNNPSLATSADINSSQQPFFTPSRQFGRVKRIVLEETNLDFEIFGGPSAISGIRVYPLGSQLDENQIDELPFAKSFDLSVKTEPLVNEIVEIFQGPAQLSIPNTQIPTSLYYSRIVNVSNSYNHNVLPDATQELPEDLDLGNGVKEFENIGSLYPFPGDTLIQGRTGASLRVSGYNHPENVYSNEENNGKPFIILSTEDVPESGDTPSLRVESLNNPGSTVFLGTDHNIFLNSKYNFKETYRESPVLKDKYRPTNFNLYKGSQIGMNTGRITLQGNEDGVFLIGNTSVGAKGGSINLEGEQYVGINAPKIYLGSKAKTHTSRNSQPAVKGREFINWEKDLLRELRAVAIKFSTVATPMQAVAVLNQVGNSLIGKINTLEKNLNKTQSKKVFIE